MIVDDPNQGWMRPDRSQVWREQITPTSSLQWEVKQIVRHKQIPRILERITPMSSLQWEGRLLNRPSMPYVCSCAFVRCDLSSYIWYAICERRETNETLDTVYDALQYNHAAVIGLFAGGTSPFTAISGS